MVSCFSLGSAEETPVSQSPTSSIHVRVHEKQNDDGTKIPITTEEVEQAIMVAKKRLQSMGVNDAQISRKGENHFIVTLTGTEREEAVRVSTKFAKSYQLELREVHPQNYKTEADGKTLAERVFDGDAIEPGYRAYKRKITDGDGKEHVTPILLNRRPAITSADIARTMVDHQNHDNLHVRLNAGGLAKMIAFTEKMRPGADSIAIVIDDEVISAPVVQQVPLGRDFSIIGLKEPGEMQTLAIALMTPLRNPLTIEEIISTPAKK